MNQPWVGQPNRWMCMNGIFKRQHLNNQFQTHLWGSNCWVSRVHAIAELKNVNWQNFVENLKQANMYWWAILHNLPPAIYYLNDNRCVRMEQLLVKLKSPGKIARNCLKGAPGFSSSIILDDLQSAKLVLNIMTYKLGTHGHWTHIRLLQIERIYFVANKQRHQVGFGPITPNFKTACTRTYYCRQIGLVLLVVAHILPC